MRRVLLLATVSIPLLTGCGAGDRRPHLPAGWRRVEAHAGAFSFGLPPGWGVHGTRGAVVVRAPRRRAVISISADRTRTGRGLRPAKYLVRVLRALRARGPFRPQLLSGDQSETCAENRALEACVVHDRREGTFSVVGFGRRGRLGVGERRAIIAIARTLRAERPR